MNTRKNPLPLKTAMILAAGYGTRMKNLTRHTPKPLLSLGKMRIIEVAIYKLAAQGIERIVINLHYKAEQFRQILGDGRRYGVEVIYSEETEILGSGGGIANAEIYFQDETIVAVNADVLCNLDIRKLYNYHCEQKALVTMNVLPSINNDDYGLVRYNDQNRLLGFNLTGQDLPDANNTGIFTGHQILSPKARAYLKAENQSIITHLYKAAIGKEENVQVHPFEGQWIDVGTEEFYHRFVAAIKSGEINLDSFIYS